MQQRFLGRTGLKVSRLGLGTLTWGRDTDEHEARDQLKSFVEAGGTLLDTAAGYGDGASEELIGSLLGDVVARDDVVLATKAGVRRARGARRSAPRGQRLPRQPAPHPRRVAAPAGHRPRRPVAGAHLVRRDAVGGDAERARLRGVDRPGGVRRGLELLRLADGAGGDLAAGRARPGAAGLEPGRVLPAQPLRRARDRPRRPAPWAWACWPGRRWAVACSPASTAPARRPTRAPPRRTSATTSGAYLDAALRRGRRGGRPGRRRAAVVAARGRAGLGPRPPGCQLGDRRGAHRGPAARLAHRRGVRAARGDPGRARRRLGPRPSPVG